VDIAPPGNRRQAGKQVVKSYFGGVAVRQKEVSEQRFRSSILFYFLPSKHVACACRILLPDNKAMGTAIFRRGTLNVARRLLPCSSPGDFTEQASPVFCRYTARQMAEKVQPPLCCTFFDHRTCISINMLKAQARRKVLLFR
jgi:hypothetical protein